MCRLSVGIETELAGGCRGPGEGTGAGGDPVAETLSRKRRGTWLANKTIFRSRVTEGQGAAARGAPSRPRAEPRIQPVSPETGGLVRKKPGRSMEMNVNACDAEDASHLPYPRLVFSPHF